MGMILFPLPRIGTRGGSVGKPRTDWLGGGKRSAQSVARAALAGHGLIALQFWSIRTARHVGTERHAEVGVAKLGFEAALLLFFLGPTPREVYFRLTRSR